MNHNPSEYAQTLLDQMATGQLNRRRFLTLASAAGPTAGTSGSPAEQAIAAGENQARNRAQHEDDLRHVGIEQQRDVRATEVRPQKRARRADARAVGGVLQKLRIAPIANLRGVGQNLQDHVLVSGVVYKYRGKMPDRPVDSNAVDAEVYLSSGLSSHPADHEDAEFYFPKFGFASGRAVAIRHS
jgi:hypothetical protein